MKKTILVSLAAAGLFATTSFANPVDSKMIDDVDPVASAEEEANAYLEGFDLVAPEHGHKGHHGSACKNINLSDDQKTQLKDTIFSFKHKMIDLKAAKKHAKLDYVQSILDPNSTLDKAKGLTDSLEVAMSAITSAKFEMKNNILFNILSTEQRKDGFMCMKQIQRMKKMKKCKGMMMKMKHKHGKHKHKHHDHDHKAKQGDK